MEERKILIGLIIFFSLSFYLLYRYIKNKMAKKTKIVITKKIITIKKESKNGKKDKKKCIKKCKKKSGKKSRKKCLNKC